MQSTHKKKNRTENTHMRAQKDGKGGKKRSQPTYSFRAPTQLHTTEEVSFQIHTSKEAQKGLKQNGKITARVLPQKAHKETRRRGRGEESVGGGGWKKVGKSDTEKVERQKHNKAKQRKPKSAG